MNSVSLIDLYLYDAYFYTINLSCLKQNQARRCHHVANLREKKHVRIENLYLQIRVVSRNEVVFSTIPLSTKNLFPRGFERNRDTIKAESQKTIEEKKFNNKIEKEKKRREREGRK